MRACAQRFALRSLPERNVLQVHPSFTFSCLIKKLALDCQIVITRIFSVTACSLRAQLLSCETDFTRCAKRHATDFHSHDTLYGPRESLFSCSNASTGCTFMGRTGATAARPIATARPPALRTTRCHSRVGQSEFYGKFKAVALVALESLFGACILQCSTPAGCLSPASPFFHIMTTSGLLLLNSASHSIALVHQRCKYWRYLPPAQSGGHP